MSQGSWPNGLSADLADLAGRRNALRQAAAMPGAAPDGTPLLMLLGATSLLSVPTSDGVTGYGVLTLARQPAEGRFTAADVALATELGRHLGVAIRVDRMFRHRSAVAEALQSSLLPARLPDVPGLELSAAYIPAGENLEVSGDFYDVFPVPDGWAVAVGDVCGKGQEAAAMTAAARHAIRAIAHWNPDPVDVLAKANEVILAGDYEDRFVTVKLAYLRRDGDHGKWAGEVASSGHPGPAVIRPDGQIDMMSGGGLPLGLFPDAEPERESVELGPGTSCSSFRTGSPRPAAPISGISRTTWRTGWPARPDAPPPRPSRWCRTSCPVSPRTICATT